MAPLIDPPRFLWGRFRIQAVHRLPPGTSEARQKGDCLGEQGPGKEYVMILSLRRGLSMRVV
jgi:hypothetical protein